MAGVPEGNQPIDGGRSPTESTFVNWFLLPLLSFCSCAREEEKNDEIDPPTQSIDKPQLGRSLAQSPSPSNQLKVDETTDEITPPTRSIDIPPVGRSLAQSPSSSNQLELDETTDEITPPTQSIEIHPVGRSLARSPSSSNELKLTDLPLLPLLVICGYLRADTASEGCRDLDNFRKTCRYFASTVNAFLQSPMNFPEIWITKIFVTAQQFRLLSKIARCDYFMHQIAGIGGSVKLDPLWSRTLIVRRRLKNDQIFELTSQVLRRLHYLDVKCSPNVINLGKLRSLLRNVIVQSLEITCVTLGDDLGRDILAILRERPVKKIHLIYDICTLTDPQKFILELGSMMRNVTLVYKHRPPRRFARLLNQSTAFWVQFLVQRMRADETQNFYVNYLPKFDESYLLKVTEKILQVEWIDYRVGHI